jgi:hypothetical protein
MHCTAHFYFYSLQILIVYLPSDTHTHACSKECIWKLTLHLLFFDIEYLLENENKGCGDLTNRASPLSIIMPLNKTKWYHIRKAYQRYWSAFPCKSISLNGYILNIYSKNTHTPFSYPYWRI